MTVITRWPDEAKQGFGRRTLLLQHELHTRPMFDDDGLASVLDRYPRDKLGVFTMGDDPVGWRTWRRGDPGQMSGAELLAAAKAGRIWLNLRAVNADLEDYAALSDEIFADKEANVPGLKTFKRDVGLLISSANAQVFYHLDTPLVSLWQLRGEKTVYVYPRCAPFVTDEQLERIVLKETAEQFAFDPAWDAAAERVHFTPGMMLTWAQNAPHRIVNGPSLNVSLSVEFMTPAALLRANAIYGAGVVRRRLGVTPAPARDGVRPGAMALAAVARGAKALKLQKAYEGKLPKTFQLDRARPGVLIDA